MKYHEEALTKGCTEEEAERLINKVNAINRLVGLPQTNNRFQRRK